jgi:hypothetical protein
MEIGSIQSRRSRSQGTERKLAKKIREEKKCEAATDQARTVLMRKRPRDNEAIKPRGDDAIRRL